MIDAAATIDVIKLRFYVDWLYQNHIYPEGDSGFHKELSFFLTFKGFNLFLPYSSDEAKLSFLQFCKNDPL